MPIIIPDVISLNAQFIGNDSIDRLTQHESSFTLARIRAALFVDSTPALFTLICATFLLAGMVKGGMGLASGDTDLTTTALGTALAIYAGDTLLARQHHAPARCESRLSSLIGGATGLVTGCTGVFVIPAVPYLQLLNLSRDHLVQALGLSFTVSTIAPAVGLGAQGAFSTADFGLSLLALLPALAGMRVGQRLRTRIRPDMFRRVFLVFLLIMGAQMSLRPLL